jgi:hypothetical protein
MHNPYCSFNYEGLSTRRIFGQVGLQQAMRIQESIQHTALTVLREESICYPQRVVHGTTVILYCTKSNRILEELGVKI